jgi:ribonuclease HI
MSSHSTPVPNQGLMFHLKRSKTNKDSTIKVFTHGVAVRRQQRCEWLWVAFDPFDKEIARADGSTGDERGLTDNAAKFHAVLEALGWLAAYMPNKDAMVLCDSKLIVRMITGRSAAGRLGLKQICHEARHLLSKTKATVEWIASSENVVRSS